MKTEINEDTPKCGIMVLTPTPEHDGGLWCANPVPCSTHSPLTHVKNLGLWGKISDIHAREVENYILNIEKQIIIESDDFFRKRKDRWDKIAYNKGREDLLNELNEEQEKFIAGFSFRKK